MATPPPRKPVPVPLKPTKKFIDSRADLIACFGRYMTNEDIQGILYMLGRPDFENCLRRYLISLDEEKARYKTDVVK